MILRMINKFNCSRLEQVYSLANKLTDVIKIKGVLKDQPYIQIDGKRINFPINEMVTTLMSSQESLQFMNNEMMMYHPTVPIAMILQENFYINKGDKLYYILTNDPIIEVSEDLNYVETNASVHLQPICIGCLKEMQDRTDISRSNLHNVLLKNVLEDSLGLKIEKIRLKETLKVVESKLAKIQEQIDEVLAKVGRVARRRMRYFTNFMLMQYAVIHYLIYFHLSWDIMEPITVLLMNFDLLVAYNFFVLNGREFTLEEIKQGIIQKKRQKNLRKYGIDVAKYQQLMEIRDYLKFKIALKSKSLHIILDALQNQIKLLDVR